MSLIVSPMISRVEAPPITEAMTWVRPGARNRELLDLCQAVPSYAPAEILQAEIARLATEPGTHLYTDINGVPELREALAVNPPSGVRRDDGGEDSIQLKLIRP